VLVLGSSLRVEPAGSLPLRGGGFVVVNLQRTPKDGSAKCALAVRTTADVAMEV
tara:strand:- start:1038 stop:1199 length:162 start_codon:yes stop_codon:yes gene_type:complete